MAKVIHPTVGRVLLYWPAGEADKANGEQPLAAMVAYVHSDRLVNIGFLNPFGEHRYATSVVLRQEGDAPPAGGYCEWMPYQVGQASKTEALRAELAGTKG